MKDNVRSIVDEIASRNALATVDVALTDEFLTFLLDESEERFKEPAEQRAFVIGGACAIGFYGREIKRGIQSESSHQVKA